jgi:hypothetical protein
MNTFNYTIRALKAKRYHEVFISENVFIKHISEVLARQKALLCHYPARLPSTRRVTG